MQVVGCLDMSAGLTENTCFVGLQGVHSQLQCSVRITAYERVWQLIQQKPLEIIFEAMLKEFFIEIIIEAYDKVEAYRIALIIY